MSELRASSCLSGGESRQVAGVRESCEAQRTAEALPGMLAAESSSASKTKQENHK